MITIVTNLPDTNADELKAIQAWLESIVANYSADEHKKLIAACALAQSHVPKQIISSGETQLRHNLATADILAQLHMDVETLQAALLQGAVSASDNSNIQLIEQVTSKSVAQMVTSMAKLHLIGDLTLPPVNSSKERQAQVEGLRRLLLGIVEDVRAVLVVLAGRLNLLRASRSLPGESRRLLALETQRLYAPLANRLGIWQIKWELEDMCLRFLEPEEYKRIANLLDERRADRERYINQVMTTLKHSFKYAGINALITGRPKHIYSIWRKMSRKRVDFDQIFDVRAVRILVDTVADCYAALGIVHGLWHHIPKEFDDYIATPKTNFYQSIHTAVDGPENKPVEIQIRTHAMHQHAELGVAAHWRYKENTGQDQELERRILWMRNWLELKTEGGEAEDFAEELRNGFESGRIYILTPQNKVVELPRGSTALDFAYSIHSEIGHSCRGAKVSGRLIPLTQPLESGQTVEIITTKHGAPSRDWLNPHAGYLHTNQARNRVRHWFKQQDFAQHLTTGRNLLDKELGRLGVDKYPNLDNIATRFNYKKADELLAAIGRGEVSAIQVTNKLGLREPQEPPPLLPVAPSSTPIQIDSSGHSALIVDGVGDLMTSMAGCCKPVPYDNLIGFITIGRGVTVHRSNCQNILRVPESQQARLVRVNWSKQPITGNYSVDMLVIAEDRKGLLRDLFAIVAGEDVNVLGVNSISIRGADIAKLRFTLEISDMQQFDRVINKIIQVPKVLEARRYI